MNAAPLPRHPLLRGLYRSGLDTAVLTAILSWAYAVLYKEVPYVPWEYPCASAACAWFLVVGLRCKLKGTLRTELLHLLLFLPALFLLTCVTSAAFLPYLAPATWPLIFVLFLRRMPRYQRILLHAASALCALAPGFFLEFSRSAFPIIHSGYWWPCLFLILATDEILLSAAAGE